MCNDSVSYGFKEIQNVLTQPFEIPCFSISSTSCSLHVSYLASVNIS